MTEPSVDAPVSESADLIAVLQRVGNLLVRPENGNPGFIDADPDGKILAVAVGHAGRALRPAVDALTLNDSRSLEERLNDLAREKPAMFAELRDVLVCSYLSTPAMWRLLGYGGRIPRPPAAGEAEGYLSGGILDAVIARGPIYRLPERSASYSAPQPRNHLSPSGEETPDEA